MTTATTMVAIDKAREMHYQAVGEALLPPGWQRLVAYIGPLLDVAEAAHELVGVTTHVNVTGSEYAERKMLYAKLRRFLERLPA